MELTLSTLSGWATITLISAAGLVPLVARLQGKKRAQPDSVPTRTHVVLGLGVVVVCFLHTGVVLPNVGAPGAAAGGMLAMIPACLGFALLIAHAGLGLQLRNVKLKDRIKKRRMHTLTAALIFVAACTHVAAIVTTPR
jgi:cytochrome b561